MPSQLDLLKQTLARLEPLGPANPFVLGLKEQIATFGKHEDNPMETYWGGMRGAPTPRESKKAQD